MIPQGDNFDQDGHEAALLNDEQYNTRTAKSWPMTPQLEWQ
jgi:hypothetical protein